MTRLLTWCLRPFTSRPAAARRRSARPALEPLEDRQLLSGLPTDMTGVAHLFGPHQGPTILYLNFDGGDVPYDRTWYGSNKVEHVAAFQSAYGQDRDRAIQDILFRVSEKFAPFNVQVERLTGAGKYDQSNGNTTVFIGPNSDADTFTPDYPGAGKGDSHQPNSDPFDIAFVNPIVTANTPDGFNEDIARAISHEAGHTFGLAHVLDTTRNPLGNLVNPDLMNYAGATATMPRFINQTLAITDLNYDPAQGTVVHDPSLQPEWNRPDPTWGWLGIKDSYPITLQNSCTYLQAVLGAAPNDPYSHVADATSVDPTYRQVAAPMLALGAAFNGAVTRQGEHDVFHLYSPLARQVTIRVDAAAGSALHPTILVCDSAGRTLLTSSITDGSAADSLVQFQAKAGQTFKVVVGGEDGASFGTFHFQIGRPPIELLVPAGNRIDLVPVSPSAPTSRFGGHEFLAPSPLPLGPLGPVSGWSASHPAVVPAVSVMAAPSLDPAVSLSEGAGQKLLPSSHGADGTREYLVWSHTPAGQTYRLIIGAETGASADDRKGDASRTTGGARTEKAGTHAKNLDNWDLKNAVEV